VIPSHQENFGIVVAEAMACSLPVLVSIKVNIWREIVSYDAGFVADDTIEETTASLRRWSALTAEEIAAMRVRQRSASMRCSTSRSPPGRCWRMSSNWPDPHRGTNLCYRLQRQRWKARKTSAWQKKPQYNAADHISPETAADPYLRPAFAASDRAKRLVWTIVRALLYRPSPRPMHGWRAFLLKCFGASMGPGCHFYPARRSGRRGTWFAPTR